MKAEQYNNYNNTSNKHYPLIIRLKDNVHILLSYFSLNNQNNKLYSILLIK